VVGGEDVKPNVAFHYLSHQTIQCAAASGHKLQNPGTFLLGIKSTLDGIDLPANPSNVT
jgi:hypothetical protein